MSYIEQIKAIAKRAPTQIPLLETEEATKNALVMPFIAALGYDVFNPLEVVPEYTADVGVKKGEKVDYAIRVDDEIVVLFECKKVSEQLDGGRHMGQLFRYFSVTKARIGVLTNGVHYRVLLGHRRAQ
ncbi:MAG TPA: type I restriction endonuclease [Polyangiaceae bacterium LLY-WYZ-15_(1-7)]|nr:type I restriction endonuclease [Polyangiaceae bacterium LLY-WYZ-15_(1-7)]HJL02954.1 type I restriction endonuclease [Polyangiaceae bacterium LLY-WYZ-15_(1-7)]HJL13658.1 type I restriction endonuclease [Polyangiaceae bacterium LLY-WYZ-15_(1-7)]HJL23116.1 type I restriction endonuclease [Polyangiaceae bacterium LLY-WYZ-15_(1-7)]HJL33499.1 type I restriction endonuclease [Polyangiaceae bacterium LLY-WYZ-15_(1-7)]